MEDVKTDKKESLDLIDYRLTAIESTLAEMKNLLLTTKLQNQSDKIKSMVAHRRSINSIAQKYGVEWETVRTYIDKHMK